MPDPNWITYANLGRLERAIDSAYGAYGRRPRGGVPFYMTEFGYKTDPPNPFVKTSPNEQATWLNQSDYMAYRNRRIRAVAQFLLFDDKPRAGAAVGSRSYWSTFQTGLLYSSGRPKPAFGAYRIPIWVPDARHGRHVTVWGQLRPSNHAVAQNALLQYRAIGSHRWKTIATIGTSSSEGFLFVRESIRAAGHIRLGWQDPANGRTDYSRSVALS
jgi:hypothetical protein